MPILTRTPPLGQALYTDLCMALKTARDWNATPHEIEVLRKAIQNRESIDVLTYQERELLSRIAASYEKRSKPGNASGTSRRGVPAAKPPATTERDLGHLSFLGDTQPASDPAETKSN